VSDYNLEKVIESEYRWLKRVNLPVTLFSFIFFLAVQASGDPLAGLICLLSFVISLVGLFFKVSHIYLLKKAYKNSRRL
jgi:hypothetical protein